MTNTRSCKKCGQPFHSPKMIYRVAGKEIKIRQKYCHRCIQARFPAPVTVKHHFPVYI